MRITLILSLLLIAGISHSQNIVNLNFFEDYHQQSFFNPAFLPKENPIRIGGPQIHFDFFHDGPALNDFIVEDGNTNKVDFGKLINELEGDMTNLQLETTINTFNIGYGKENWHVQLSHRSITNFNLNYSNQLTEVLWFGNAPYLGENLNLSTDINSRSYSELGLSLAYKLPIITVGARIKLLNGIADLQTTNNRFNFTTRENDLALLFDTDYELLSSSVIDYEGIDELSLDFFQSPFKNIFSKNSGFGLDLGVTLNLSEKIELGASVTNIGQINWDNDVQILSTNVNDVYTGILLEDLISINELDFTFDGETIEEILQIQNTAAANYSTTLDPTFNLHGKIKLTDKISGGVAMQYQDLEISQGNFDLSIWGNYQVLGFLRAGVSWTGHHSELDNIGLHFQVDLGPLQIVASSYNIESIVQALNSRKANGFVGVNLSL